MKYSLDGSLPKMCPAVQTFDQDGLEVGITGHIFGRGGIQGSIHQSLVAIVRVVSEEKIFM
jgi:hypothetical protein